jgi:hypothetical protein
MSATVTLIADLILERPLCISCIATKAGEPSAEALETLLKGIRHVFQLHRARGQCRACGANGFVLSLERPRDGGLRLGDRAARAAGSMKRDRTEESGDDNPVIKISGHRWGRSPGIGAIFERVMRRRQSLERSRRRDGHQ